MKENEARPAFARFAVGRLGNTYLKLTIPHLFEGSHLHRKIGRPGVAVQSQYAENEQCTDTDRMPS